jgi:hypothetical protein
VGSQRKHLSHAELTADVPARTVSPAANGGDLEWEGGVSAGRVAAAEPGPRSHYSEQAAFGPIRMWTMPLSRLLNVAGARMEDLFEDVHRRAMA